MSGKIKAEAFKKVIILISSIMIALAISLVFPKKAAAEPQSADPAETGADGTAEEEEPDAEAGVESAKTGDASRMELWLALMILAAGAAAAAALRKREKESA